MATFEQNGIKFKRVNTGVIPVGAPIGVSRYIVDENKKIQSTLPAINAIDINWNEAQIDSENVIKTTADLLYYIKGHMGTKGDDGRSAYEVYVDSLKTFIEDAIIVDHTNFAEARHNQLEDYYINFPSEAVGDGETWPPYNPAMFPWLVVNYNFNGEETLHIEYKGEERLVWTPSAEVTCENGTKVPRTYGIISVSSSEDLGLSEFTETVEGNELLANIDDFKVYITTETILTEEEWLASLVGPTGPQGESGIVDYSVLEDYYTKDQADAKFATKESVEALLLDAPEAFDTFKEIADELANETSAIAAINNVLSEKANADDVYTKTAADALFLTGHQDISNKVDWVESIPGRHHIVLKNHDSILGTATDEQTYNIAMVSKWDVVDLGTTHLHMNLNTSDAVTINDDKVVATVDQLDNYQPKGDYLTSHQSLDGYAKTADIEEAYQPKGDYLTSHQSLDEYATKIYVDNKITDVIGGAPEALDTLKEIADALADNATLTDLTNALASKANSDDVYTKTEIDDKLGEFGKHLTVYDYTIQVLNDQDFSPKTTLTGKLKVFSSIEGHSTSFTIATCDQEEYADQIGKSYTNYHKEGYEGYLFEYGAQEMSWPDPPLYLSSQTLDEESTSQEEDWNVKDYVDYNITDNINTLGHDTNQWIAKLQNDIDDRYTKAETDIFYDHTIFFDLLVPAGISNGLLTIEELTGEWNHYDQGNDHEHACTSYSEFKALVSDAHNAIKFRWFDNGANEILVLTPSFFVLNSGIYFTCVYNSNNETKTFRIVVPNDGTQQPGTKIVYKLYNKSISVPIDAYTKAESDNKYQPVGNYLTSHQDLSGYATEGYVDENFNSLYNLLTLGDPEHQIPGAWQWMQEGFATEDYVGEKIADLIGAAPAALDTLEEIADKLLDNDDVVSALTNTIASKADATSVYTKDEVYNMTESDAKYAPKETVDTLIANAPENFDTLKEFADSLADLKVVDVPAQEAIPGEHYTQEEIDAAVEGDEAYGKTTDDWKVEPIPAVEEEWHNMTIGEFVTTSMQAVDEKTEVQALQTRIAAIERAMARMDANAYQAMVNSLAATETLETANTVTIEEGTIADIIIPETTKSKTVTGELDPDSTLTLNSRYGVTINNTSEEPTNLEVTAPSDTGNYSAATITLKDGEFDTVTLTDASLTVQDNATVQNVVITEETTKALTINALFEEGATITSNSEAPITLNNKNGAEEAVSVTLNAPGSTVTLSGGQWVTISGAVSQNTLIIKKNAKVQNLNITEGNVIVEVARQADIANVITGTITLAEGCNIDYIHDEVGNDNSSVLTSTGEHTLVEDINKGGRFAPGTFASDDIIWNLNGHNMTFTNTAGYANFLLRGTLHLEINGNGTITNNAGDYGFWLNSSGSKLVVNGGTYYAATHILYAQQGTIEVNGGEFHLTDADTAEKDANGNFKFLLNCLDANYTAGTAKIIVRGGTFYGFNPAESYGEPGGPVSFIATGYESVQIGTDGDLKIYEVRPIQA